MSLRRRSSLTLPLAVLAFAATACVTPATEVLVVFDTDAPLDRALTLTATVEAPGSDGGERHVWSRGGGAPDAASLPASFAIIPRAGASLSEPATLVIDVRLAPDSGGSDEIRFQRTVRFVFVPHETGVVRIFLPIGCGSLTSGCTMAAPAQCTVSQRCAESDRTCGDLASCVDPMITPVSSQVDDGSVNNLRRDLGAPDVQHDTGVDAFDAIDIVVPPDVAAPMDAVDIADTCAHALCSGGCVDITTDVNNCGACGNPCAPRANGIVTCVAGTCAVACVTGFHLCGSNCVDNHSTSSCGPSSCSPCPMPSNATATCDGTACGSACNAGFHVCGGACVNSSSVATCGSSCTPCNTAANGTATCAAGVCGIACNAGYHNCGGVCANSASVATCGALCTPCGAVANGTPSCNGVACGAVCNPGFMFAAGACVAATHMTVFVSSAVYNGNMVGLAGADANCQTLANAASLGATFRAWMSDEATTAASRLTHAALPYQLVDGTVIANNWTGLVSGTLLHPINRTERNGAPPPGGTNCGVPTAWTDTGPDGTRFTVAGFSCTNWTSTAGGSVWGQTTATDLNWTEGCNSGSCGWTSAIYCVQQ